MAIISLCPFLFLVSCMHNIVRVYLYPKHTICNVQVILFLILKYKYISFIAVIFKLNVRY